MPDCGIPQTDSRPLSCKNIDMTTFPDTWLIVPMYNEGSVVRDVIEDARLTFPNVVCVDDGSQDDSVEHACEAGAVVLRHPVNLGQGAALQTGFRFVVEQTDARFAATFDSDGQHDPKDVAAMRMLAETDDLAAVFGSRFLENTTPVGWSKRAVLRFAAFVTRMRTGMKMTDAHNGLRLFRRDALQAISLRHNRMAHASEIVTEIRDSGLPWREMPVHIRYTEYSKSKGQSLLNSVNILVELVMD